MHQGQGLHFIGLQGLVSRRSCATTCGATQDYHAPYYINNTLRKAERVKNRESLPNVDINVTVRRYGTALLSSHIQYHISETSPGGVIVPLFQTLE